MPKDDLVQDALTVTLGQHSRAGRKPQNQDFFGAMIPSGSALRLKGIALAVADGISSSQVSREAAETAVKSLLTEYYGTSDAWEVKTAACNVISATNAWLYGINRRALHDSPDLGHVCTLSALILKGHFAHLFHVGDSRIWRVAGTSLEPLTQDHVTRISASDTQLSRAMGLDRAVNVDHRKLRLSAGDVFLLTTDGIHDHWTPGDVVAAITSADSLDAAAATIADQALAAGSPDNLTVQIVRIDALPGGAHSPADSDAALPVLAMPNPGDTIDGFRIVRPIHSNNRSHIFLAIAPSGQKVAFKVPATEIRSDPNYIRMFLMEEWIARRLSSPHVVKAVAMPETRSGLYVVTEFIEGQTLRQWMRNTPAPTMAEVSAIASQMIRGLRAFHRKDMLHQDFRPENLMIDSDGTVKILDLGSTRVAGIEETRAEEDTAILGTLQYTAPEYFVGDPVGPWSDQFSLGVILYEMLTGRLPYGADAARVGNRRDRARLKYRLAADGANSVPYWIDDVLRRAVHPNANQRFAALSELDAALSAPPKGPAARTRRPLATRNPVLFWQTVSAALAAAVFALLVTR
ncbi:MULTISPECIES: protein kinase domain-containing protein [unclassified Marinovum]